MKKLSQLLESRYIQSPEEVEQMLKTAKQITEAKLIIPDVVKQCNLKKLTRIILIGEMRYKSMRKQNIKLDYCDPTKLEYEIKNDKIHVHDDKYKFDVKPEDAENTVVFCRSGYKNSVITFLLNEIKQMGITIFNEPEYVNISNNKYLTALLLNKYNIPQPKFCLVSHDDIHKGDHDVLDKKLKSIYDKVDDDTKFVCKILGGHGGKGVFTCTGDNITSVLQAIFAIKEDTLILVQEFLHIKEGDIRAHVLTLNGNQELLDTSMRIKGEHDFRTNLSLGNSMKEYTLTKDQEKIVFAAAKASGLAWCGVDLLQCEDGKNVVLELNGAPGSPVERKEDLEEGNEKFWSKFIDTVNKLC